MASSENETGKVGRGAFAPGQVVAGKYRIDRVLGEGGMGVVVAATHEQLDQKVALKFLLPEVATHPEVVQRFMREARAAVKIHSEHVARVMDVGTLESGTPYMVMEYLAGEDLGQVVASRGPLPVEEAVGYLLEASEAVAEAHALGIVHRDLKPANIFLAQRPSGPSAVKVLDFGISKVPTTAKEASITTASAMMGSPGYMSPEQMLAAGTADARSDIWSFGVVLHELLTGDLPFAGQTMPELVAAILHKPHVPMGSVRADLPPGLQEIVDRCLEKNPAHRHPHVAALARALAPFGPSKGALSLERIDHVLGLRSSMGAAVAPAVGQPATRSSHAWYVLLPGGLVVAVVAGGLLFASRAGHRVDVETARPPAMQATVAPGTSAAPSTTALTSASAPVASVLSAPSASVVAAAASVPAKPGWMTAPRPSATSAPKTAPSCHVAAYFDADGDKHFRQECP